VALVGGLLFLLAEGSSDAKRVFALLPGLETEAEKKNHMLQVRLWTAPSIISTLLERVVVTHIGMFV
jgi:hypothetical protein